jgi:hypothetical protein
MIVLLVCAETRGAQATTSSAAAQANLRSAETFALIPPF